MKFGSKVICLARDTAGFGPSLYQALQPQPSSGITREDSCFELPIGEKYGVKEQTIPIQTAQFCTIGGSLQVSLLLLPDLEQATVACVTNELLVLITLEESNRSSMLITSCYVDSHKIAKELMPSSFDTEVKIYGMEIGETTESTQQMLIGVSKVTPTLRIYCETLNCLLHLAQVYRLPTILLAATSRQRLGTGSADQELEALYEAGEFIARRCTLSFSRDKVCKKQIDRVNKIQEPWRALYG